jgi:hypothetical protein
MILHNIEDVLAKSKSREYELVFKRDIVFKTVLVLELYELGDPSKRMSYTQKLILGLFAKMRLEENTTNFSVRKRKIISDILKTDYDLNTSVKSIATHLSFMRSIGILDIDVDNHTIFNKNLWDMIATNNLDIKIKIVNEQ